jgi:kumamolisin
MKEMCSRRTSLRAGLSCVAASGLLALATAMPGAMAASVRIATDMRVHDLGVDDPSSSGPFVVVLGLRNQAALDALLADISNPRSPNFRKFLTPAEFGARFGQSPETVAEVTSYLTSQGFTVTKSYANNLLLTVSGSNAQIAATFGATVHDYELNGLQYWALASKPVFPPQLSSVVALAGLSSKPTVNSHRAAVPRGGLLAHDASIPLGLPTPGRAATGMPGSYTVADLALQNNINPLYAKGLTGAGKTIGIVTLAAYDQSDVYAYWNAIGVDTGRSRITDVLVEGGASAGFGPGSDGAGETTLDIEQAGGLAPGAEVRVYIGPATTDSGFIDTFAQAIDENVVDVLSTSWGGPEINSDPALLTAYHALFEQAAAQGMPVIAASGDSGAFDVYQQTPYPGCTTLLSVDWPASDPLVLAAGGTTLPNATQHKFGVVAVNTERPWGWDYLKGYVVANYGQDEYYANYYGVGGGGGVAMMYPRPAYQGGLAGVLTSASAQSLYCGPTVTGAGWQDFIDLPGGYAGRNVPDVSLDADPFSGYLVYEKGAWTNGNGGTSFVAPQLNGILALISQGVSGRIGQIGPQLYAAFKAKGYAAGSPFRAITAGDNEYYKAASHYNPATGLGSLDVEALARTLGATP